MKASEAAVERSGNQIEDVEHALAARIGSVHASVAQVKAQLAEAELNLSYTKVVAPCSGVITNLQLSEGSYAHIGQAVLACIDTRHWLVVANFRERSLEQMRPGQPALVAFQAIPGRLFRAEVQTLGYGVSQGRAYPRACFPTSRIRRCGCRPPSDFRSGWFSTIRATDELPLRVGMTGSVSVYVEPDARLNDVTEMVHRILSWLYYL